MSTKEKKLCWSTFKLSTTVQVVALHGARVLVTPVLVELEGGCADTR